MTSYAGANAIDVEPRRKGISDDDSKGRIATCILETNQVFQVRIRQEIMSIVKAFRKSLFVVGIIRADAFLAIDVYMAVAVVLRKLRYIATAKGYSSTALDADGGLAVAGMSGTLLCF